MGFILGTSGFILIYKFVPREAHEDYIFVLISLSSESVFG